MESDKVISIILKSVVKLTSIERPGNARYRAYLDNKRKPGMLATIYADFNYVCLVAPHCVDIFESIRAQCLIDTHVSDHHLLPSAKEIEEIINEIRNTSMIVCPFILSTNEEGSSTLIKDPAKKKFCREPCVIFDWCPYTRLYRVSFSVAYLDTKKVLPPNVITV